MNSSQVRARETAAMTIARSAGELALGYFRRREELEVERKTAGVYDTATVADRSVEAFIRERLAESFPGDQFFGEEGAASGVPQGAGPIWVVDPIDGTDCFVNGIPIWCISMALVCDSAVQIGVIFDPNHDDLYVAVRGLGATLNGRPMRASTVTSLADGVVGIGVNHRVTARRALAIASQLLLQGGMFQRNGSGALMLAYVASARFIGYFEEHINAWDALAGVLLVREAGGWTNEFFDHQCLSNGNVIIAAAPGVEQGIRELCEGDIA